MKYKSIKAIEAVLQKHVAQVSRTSGDNQSLNRMWPLLEVLDNPHEKLNVIHVAGTSGKTSTCYYVTALLSSSGFKVGTTVSPHIDSITERIQIDGAPITEADFCRYFSRFYSLVENVAERISYFELMVAFELWVFVQETVDYAVIETGMGGLLDATNVVTRQDKVAVITTIGYDHMHILGNTLSQIASQKAGIIHNKNHVFVHKQSENIMKEIQARAHTVEATIHVEKTQIEIPFLVTSDLASYQKINLSLAYSTCQYISSRDGFSLASEFTAPVIVPARMEIVKLLNGNTLVTDGAHNPQKMKAFVSSFQKMYPNKKATVLLSLKEGKDFAETIVEMHSITDSYLLTSFSTSQDLPATAINPELLKKHIESANQEANIHIHTDLKMAVDSMLQTDNNSIKVVTGSFYLIGQVRAYLKSISMLQ